MKRFFPLLLGACLAALPHLAPAQISWDGGGTNDAWSNPANWSPEGVPTSTDVVEITVDDTVQISSVDQIVDSLYVGASNARIEIGSGLTLTTNSGYQQDQGTLAGDGTLTVQGRLRWTGGTMAGTGMTTAAGGFEMGFVTLDQRRLVLPSGERGRVFSFDDPTGRNGAVIEVQSNAVFEIQDQSQLTTGSGAAPRLVNDGTVVRTSGSSFANVDWQVQNTDTVKVETGGSLHLNGALVGSGGTPGQAEGVYQANAGELRFYRDSTTTFTSGSVVEGDTTVEFRSTSSADTKYTIGGTFDARGELQVGGSDSTSVTIASEATLTELGGEVLRMARSGALRVNTGEAGTPDSVSVGRLRLDPESRLEPDPVLAVEGETRLDNASATLRTDNSVIFRGTLRWRGGTVAGGGTLRAERGFEWVGGPGSAGDVKTMDGVRLVLPAGETGRYPGAVMRGTNGAVLEIESGAVFDVQDDSDLSVVSGTTATAATVVNRGTFKKTADDFGSSIEWAFQNSGTVETAASTGPLDLNGQLVGADGMPGVAEGTFRATGGPLRFFPDSSTTFTSGTVVAGDTTIAFRTGTSSNTPIRIEGELDARGELQVAGNDSTAVTIASDATLTELGTDALWMGRSGQLRINTGEAGTPDSVSVGRLRLDPESRLEPGPVLTVQGETRLDNANATLRTDNSVIFRDKLRWRGGTVAGGGTLRAERGFEWIGGPGSAGDVKTMDGVRLVLPTGETGRYPGAVMRGRNDAVLEIESGAVFDVQDDSDLSVVSGTTATAATIVNRGTFRKTVGDFGSAVEWALQNSGTVETAASTGPLDLNGQLVGSDEIPGVAEGTFRATGGPLRFFPDSSTTFTSGSVVEGDTTLAFRSSTFSDTPIRIEGELDARGTLQVGGNDSTSVTVGSGATLTELGAGAVQVVDRGELQVNTSGAITIGRLRLGNRSRFVPSSDVTVQGEARLTDDQAEFVSNSALTLQDTLRWGAGTMAGSDTTFAQRGFTMGDDNRSPRLDERTFVLPSGETGVEDDGSNFIGANGAQIVIQSGALFEIRESPSFNVASGSTTPPRIVNRGILRYADRNGGNNVNVRWQIQNTGLIETNATQDLFIDGTLVSGGGTLGKTSGDYRVRSNRLSIRPDSALAFTSESRLEADTSAQMEFSSLVTSNTPISVAGTLEVRGKLDVGEDDSTSVTVESGATVTDLGGEALVVNNEGQLRVNTSETDTTDGTLTDTLRVGRLRIGDGTFRPSRAVVATGETLFQDNMALFESDSALVMRDTLRWGGGTMAGPDTTVAERGFTMENDNAGPRLDERTFVLPSGETGIEDDGSNFIGANGAQIVIQNGALFEIRESPNFNVSLESTTPPRLVNRGTVHYTDRDGGNDVNVRWQLQNTGLLRADATQTLHVAGQVFDGSGTADRTSGTYLATDARLDLAPNADTLRLAREALVAIDTLGTVESTVPMASAGTLAVAGELFMQSPVRVTGGGIALQDSGRIARGTVGNVASDPDTVVTLRGGTLQGVGTLTGDLIADGGVVQPGTDGTAGEIIVDGTYTQTANGRLNTELGGTTAGTEYDLLRAREAVLAGTLDVERIDDYDPTSSDVLEPVRWTDSLRTGTFGQINQPSGNTTVGVEYGPAALKMFRGTLPTQPPSALTASAPDDSVTLEWAASSSGDVAAYRIYRDTTSIDSSAGPSSLAALDSTAAGATTYVDTSASLGQTYYYRVTAVDTARTESGFSNEATARPTSPPEIGVSPSSLTETVALGDSSTQTLQIENVATSGAEDLNFEILIADADSGGAPTAKAHVPGESEPIEYDGPLGPAGPATGAIGWSSPQDGYDWYCAVGTAGEPITLTAERTSGDILPNLGVGPGEVDEGAPVSELPGGLVNTTSNSSDSTVTLTYTPPTDGVVTVFVATWTSQQDGGEYSLSASGIERPSSCGGGLPWVAVEPGTGSVSPGQSRSIDVNFSATETPPGTYEATLRVASNDPAQDTTEVPVSLTVERPPVSLAGPDELPAPGEGTTVEVDLPPNVAVEEGTLFYRRAGARAFQDTTRALADVEPGGTATFPIPGSAVTTAGVQYYVTLRGSVPGGGETVELTVPSTAPIRTAFLAARTPRVAAQGTFQSETYRMLSVPADLGDRSVFDVLESQYGSYDPGTWKFARWAPRDSSYQFGSEVDSLRSGQAAWLITAEGDSLTVQDVQSIDASEPRPIPLAPGWNQIGSPFPFPVAWTEVRRPESVRSLFAYDTTGYQADAPVLRPWRGYFVYNRADTSVTLQVPPVEVGSEETRQSTALATAGGSGYRLQPVATLHRDGQTWSDPATWLGFAEGAKAGFGPKDRAKPPAMGPHVRLHAVSKEGPALARSLKPRPSDGAVWDLRVGLRLEDRLTSAEEVTVVFNEEGALPSGFTRYVVDRDRDRRLPVTNQSVTVTLTPEQPTRRLRVVVGTEAFARENSGGASLAIAETRLRANAPNPFATSTTIPYQLAEEADVTIAIYDLLGRRVRTLVDETQQPGVHRVEWRPGQGGEALASGVYFCRMTAGSYRATRKIALVR